ncbi:MAG: cell division protein FtsQ/DivIB [Steroidobacteraceae bacterium]
MLQLRNRNRNRRRRESPPDWLQRLPGWRSLGIAALAVAGGGALLALLVGAFNQRVERIEVHGALQRVSAMDVEQAVKRELRGNGLVRIDLAVLQAAVEHIAWVDTATIARSWPRAIVITIAEQRAAARWGESGLLNERGELFMSDARHVPPELPRLSGPQGSEQEVARRYLNAAGRLTEAGVHLAAVRLDDRGAYEFDLDNGVTVRLGRKNVDERFERFLAAALPMVLRRARDITYVDMRYSNGYAVGWSSGQRRASTMASGDAEKDA